MKRHWGGMRKMREEMEVNYKKIMREAVGRARDEFVNNGSTSSTTDDVRYLSIPIPMSELFDEKKIGITGIDREDKYREEEKMMRAVI